MLKTQLFSIFVSTLVLLMVSYLLNLGRFFEDLSFWQSIDPLAAWDILIAFLSFNNETEHFDKVNDLIKLMGLFLLLLPSLLTYILLTYLIKRITKCNLKNNSIK